MGNSLDEIIKDLPKEITDDPYFTHVAAAFNLYLDIKYLLNSEDEFTEFEASHAVSKKYEARIKTRDEEERLEWLMRCNREDTFLFDNIDCKNDDN
uniref:Uncharacterized protein n=1 Tax=Panagrolaimus sp. PS1159 TaxID=55785 RepID=A0AC35FV28_9BILA